MTVQDTCEGSRSPLAANSTEQLGAGDTVKEREMRARKSALGGGLLRRKFCALTLVAACRHSIPPLGCMFSFFLLVNRATFTEMYVLLAYWEKREKM